MSRGEYFSPSRTRTSCHMLLAALHSALETLKVWLGLETPYSDSSMARGKAGPANAAANATTEGGIGVRGWVGVSELGVATGVRTGFLESGTTAAWVAAGCIATPWGVTEVTLSADPPDRLKAVLGPKPIKIATAAAAIETGAIRRCRTFSP